MSLRAARVALGMTQRQLARRAGVCVRTVYKAERGRACRQEIRRKLLRALGVPWEERDALIPLATAPGPRSRS